MKLMQLLEKYWNLALSTIKGNNSTYYCETCNKELFLENKNSPCPLCGAKCINLEYDREEYKNLSEEEKNIIIQASTIKNKNSESAKTLTKEIKQDIAENTKNLSAQKILVGFGVLVIVCMLVDEIF